MNNTEFWFAVKITADPRAAEAVEFALNSLDSLGTEINNLRKDSDEDVCVVGYFDRIMGDEEIKSELASALKAYDLRHEMIRHIDSNEVEDQDWLAEWKKHWKPTETGKFIIAPPWESIEGATKHVIRIEPNMAFGTGTHETTKLCLKAIEKYFAPGMSFLDVGTGTGILAIAVSKLSEQTSAEIIACDTDADSIKIAKENAVLNGAAEIEIFEGAISEDTKACDLVCANVTADVIIPMLSLLFQKSKKLLVLSGILAEQEDEVLTEIKKFQSAPSEIEKDGEWISVVIRRDGIPAD
ncbi:MAG: 50S ribosomal protein L11 methyltransferase [Pyrinomonadaceae bacterium]